MQQVKTDGAAVWIKDRISQQVIDVDQIGTGNRYASAQPMRTPKDERNPKRSQPVPPIVQSWL